MADVFPTALFGFKSQDVNIERQTLSGGTALSGETDVVSTDGGGRVYAEFGEGDLIDRDKVLAWRALITILEEGVTEMVVPFCDIRHQPHGGEHAATYIVTVRSLTGADLSGKPRLPRYCGQRRCSSTGHFRSRLSAANGLPLNTRPRARERTAFGPLTATLLRFDRLCARASPPGKKWILPTRGA